MPRRSLLLPACLLALLLALAGCGNKEEVVKVGETEGAYLDVGGLKYQIQNSRELNVFSPDDRSYLRGLAPEDARLETGGACQEVFFAVFMRVENADSPTTEVSALDFEIRDTQANVYTPLEFTAPGGSEWAYRSEPVPPKQRRPLADTAAGERPPYGSVLVFKLCRFSLDNRPLEFVIRSPDDPRDEGLLDLDV